MGRGRRTRALQNNNLAVLFVMQSQNTPTLRVFRPDEWRAYRQIRLEALADSPDAYGATLASAQARADADWSAQIAHATDAGKDLPLVAEINGCRIGLAWAKINADDPTTVNIYQMWVSPRARGQGIGRMLLAAAIDWAGKLKATAVVLAVTCGDTAAARLYARVGFRPVGKPEPLRPESSLLAQNLRLEIM